MSLYLRMCIHGFIIASMGGEGQTDRQRQTYILYKDTEEEGKTKRKKEREKERE